MSKQNKTLSNKNKQIIWALAAGHCEFPNCNKRLIGDLISQTAKLKKGLIAHIVAASPGGARGDVIRSPQLIDDVDNLMLLCHDHHVLIDGEERDNYPEELLISYKKRHEDRIQIQASIMEDAASHILIYTAPIGKHEVSVNRKDVENALIPKFYPATNDTIELNSTGVLIEDSQDHFWTFHSDNLDKLFSARVSGRIETDKINHLSIFAIAPQPLLIKLGSLIGDIVPAKIYQSHRQPKTWKWQDSNGHISFQISKPETKTGKPALKLALSATINDERICNVLGEDVSIWSISVSEPGLHLIRSEDHLKQFGMILQKLFNEIKSVHGEEETIHVFPAVPVSAAVEVGSVWMSKADLPLKIYDQNQDRNGFVPTLTIGQSKESSYE